VRDNTKLDKKALEQQKTAGGIRKKEVMITIADESNNVVIMGKEGYKQRVLKMIADGPYEEISEEMMVNDVNQILNRHKKTICGDKDPRFELREWRPSNPKIPKLYAQAKTHKFKEIGEELKKVLESQELKMRPVASNINAPTEKIAKKLVEIFGKLKPPKGRSVKSYKEFIERAKKIEN